MVHKTLFRLAASRPIHQAVTLALICHSVHYAKRLYETQFVHRFSNGTMPIRNLFKVKFWQYLNIKYSELLILLGICCIYLLLCQSPAFYATCIWQSSIVWWSCSFCTLRIRYAFIIFNFIFYRKFVDSFVVEKFATGRIKRTQNSVSKR